MNIIILMLLIFILPTNMPAQAKRLHPEKYYQNKWCKGQGGVTEFYLSDRTRVDCLTPGYAIEFDFANKAYESVGQALYYAIKTDRKPGVVLIIENPSKDAEYLRRLKTIANKYNIKVWEMK